MTMPKAKQRYTDKYGTMWTVLSVRQIAPKGYATIWKKEISLIAPSDMITDESDYEVEPDGSYREGRKVYALVTVCDRLEDIEFAWQEFVAKHGLRNEKK